MVLPTVLLPVQQMCFCVQGENVIFHACMHVWVCVWEWMVFSCYIEFIHHARHLQERQKARGCNLGALLVSSLLSFLLYIAYWNGDLDKGCKQQKKKRQRKEREVPQTPEDLKSFFSSLFFFSWMTCKGCFWVPNVCKARAMWRIVMGRIVSLFPSCTHLFYPFFFHPCTDVVAAFTQPWWTFAKLEKRWPKCLNCL